MMSILSWSSLIANIVFIAFLIIACWFIIGTVRKYKLFTNSTIIDIIEQSEDTKKKGCSMKKLDALHNEIKAVLDSSMYFQQLADEGAEHMKECYKKISREQWYKAQGMIEALNIITNNNYCSADF